MRTLLGRIVRAVNPELWQAANPEGRPLGLNDFRRNEVRKVECLDEGDHKAAAYRGIGTSQDMVNRHYADRRRQSHVRTQRVQHNFESLTSEAVAVPSTSGTPPPPVPAPRQMAHPSTSINSPQPVPALRPKRQAEISPVASASSSGNTNPNPNPPPVPAPRPAKRMTVAAVVKPLGGAASTSSANKKN